MGSFDSFKYDDTKIVLTTQLTGAALFAVTELSALVGLIVVLIVEIEIDNQNIINDAESQLIILLTEGLRKTHRS